MTDLKELLDFGFENAGNWEFNPNDELTNNLLPELKKKNVVYAFIIKEEVKYIGKAKNLGSRMNWYKRGQVEKELKVDRVSINNRLLIKNLKKVNQIPVYVYVIEEKIPYKNLKIDITVGVEQALIEKYSPLWNDITRNHPLYDSLKKEILKEE